MHVIHLHTACFCKWVLVNEINFVENYFMGNIISSLKIYIDTNFVMKANLAAKILII